MWGRKPLTEKEQEELRKKRERQQAEEKGHSFYICQKCEREFSVYSPLPKKNKELASVPEPFCFTCGLERDLKRSKEYHNEPDDANIASRNE